MTEQLISILSDTLNANKWQIQHVIKLIKNNDPTVHDIFEFYSQRDDNSVAQYMLGFMYELGNGVEKNLWKALDWYKASSDQGYLDPKDLCVFMNINKEKIFDKYVDMLVQIDKLKIKVEENNKRIEELENYNGGDEYKKIVEESKKMRQKI